MFRWLKKRSKGGAAMPPHTPRARVAQPTIQGMFLLTMAVALSAGVMVGVGETARAATTSKAAAKSVAEILGENVEARDAQSKSRAAVVEPDGYRFDDYMSPVPQTLKGAMTIDATALHKRLSQDSQIVLIDVLPLRRKPPDFPPNRLWLTPKRHNIPNSVWLPNVGYGDIVPEFEEYFIRHLKRLTGDKQASAELVFYCLDNCWMSWNAAKRALELGYDNVFWFPGGTDEWEVMGYELELAKPEKMPDFVPLNKKS